MRSLNYTFIWQLESTDAKKLPNVVYTKYVSEQDILGTSCQIYPYP